MRTNDGERRIKESACSRSGSGVGIGSSVRRGSAFGGVEDFHGALEQFLKFAAFDFWACGNEVLRWNDYGRILLDDMTIG